MIIYHYIIILTLWLEVDVYGLLGSVNHYQICVLEDSNLCGVDDVVRLIGNGTADDQSEKEEVFACLTSSEM